MDRNWPVCYSQANISPHGLRGTPVHVHICGEYQSVVCERHKERRWENRNTERTQASVFYEDSLSSRVGVASIVYGAEAGTGPGVRADGSGDRSDESSGLLPQPLMWRAPKTLFFFLALQGQRATNTTGHSGPLPPVDFYTFTRQIADIFPGGGFTGKAMNSIQN